VNLVTLDRAGGSISDSSILSGSISYAFSGAIAYQFTVKVKVCEWLTPFEVPVIVKA
jgi:hypothetical protein